MSSCLQTGDGPVSGERTAWRDKSNLIVCGIYSSRRRRSLLPNHYRFTHHFFSRRSRLSVLILNVGTNISTRNFNFLPARRARAQTESSPFACIPCILLLREKVNVDSTWHREVHFARPGKGRVFYIPTLSIHFGTRSNYSQQ